MSELWATVVSWAAEHFGLSATTLEHLIWTVIVLVLYFVLRFSTFAVLEHRISDVSRKYIANKTFSYIYGFALTFALLVVWFGNAAGWAAYLGIVSAGLAIALQDPVTNFAGWIFISVRKPFAVGDRIEIGTHRGDVIDMRLFQFTLMEIGNWVDSDQSTGRIIHIPNGWVFKHSTANYTAGFNFIWNELPITITFESNWDKAKQVLIDVASKHSIVKTQEAQEQIRRAARKYMIYFQLLTPIVWTSVADNGVTLTVRYICEPRKRRSSQTAVWEDVLKAFATADDIDFAYPTTRFYHNVAEGKPGARAPGPSE